MKTAADYRMNAATALLAVIRGRVALSTSTTGYVSFLGSDVVRGIIREAAERARSCRRAERGLLLEARVRRRMKAANASREASPLVRETRGTHA